MSNHNFQSLRALIGDEADNNDNYYRDPEHITAIQADIAQGKKDNISVQLAKWIRQKKFGIDVREALARFIEWTSVLSNESLSNVNDVANAQSELKEDMANFEKRYAEQISSNTDLNEVIDARTNLKGETFTTLKERIDDQENFLNGDKFDIDDNAVIGGVKVRDVFVTALDKLVQEADTNKFVVGIGTDWHVSDMEYNQMYANGEYSYSHINNLLYLGNKADVLIAGGDNVDAEYDSLDKILQDTRTVSSIFLNNTCEADRFVIIGNHDDGSGRYHNPAIVGKDDFVKEEQFKTIYRTRELLNDEIREDGSLYFYKDYADKKIRLIGLWTHDIDENDYDSNTGYINYPRWSTDTFRQKQVDFLVNALQTTPTDYHVIIFGHCPLWTDWNKSISLTPNHDIIKGLLNAFVNGSYYNITSSETDFPLTIDVDFSSHGAGNLVGYFAGHTHRELIEDIGNFKSVHFQDSIGYSDEAAASQVRNSVKEDALSLVEVDTSKRTVTIKGLGRANDRSYIY
jgi:hypothetical protein